MASSAWAGAYFNFFSILIHIITLLLFICIVPIALFTFLIFSFHFTVVSLPSLWDGAQGAKWVLGLAQF